MKTDQYFCTLTLAKITHQDPDTQKVKLLESSGPSFGDPNMHIGWEWITKPGVRVPAAHKHDFDEYFTFLGGDPNNMLELNGEVEMLLDNEKHTFTKATTIFLPKGMDHCPLTIKKLDKPFIYSVFYIGPAYSKTK